ncbi:MAG: hypothetical protein JWR33_404 [Naasia sp.]|jgi:protein-tyrosine phosphatase|uniref:arsenate reductase/protein-tyrosine-phosphatase family protein n=1 Tax=Naasia sp. TaxID=2546198 RepID=UPI00262AC024|nr:low molecular weight phosphatase family protein [Naasia sp.]MCU1569663.1 hypothetical protein [Naasia sp.]
MTEGGFRVLVVCTGNICRSPIAEQLLRARTSEGGVAFSSAGTGATPGAAMPGEAAELSRAYGGEPDGHVARRITRALIDESDLVLTAAREHRGAVVELSPRASRHTFTILQFARLLASVDPVDLAAAGTPAEVVAAAAARRGYARPGEDDIPDPYRRSFAEYQVAAALIDDAVAQIATALDRRG